MSHLTVPPLKPEVIFLQLTEPQTSAVWLDSEGEAALEPGVVPGQVHLAHVTPGLQTASRGGQPFPLAVGVEVDPPAPLPVAVSPAEQCGRVPHTQAQAGAPVHKLQREVRLGEILEAVGEDDVERKY